MYVHIFIYVHMGAGAMDIRSHGDAGYEPPDVDAWNQLSNCGKAVSMCSKPVRVISPAPNVYILTYLHLFPCSLKVEHNGSHSPNTQEFKASLS